MAARSAALAQVVIPAAGRPLESDRITASAIFCQPGIVIAGAWFGATLRVRSDLDVDGDLP
jgi:hypothetical protein